MPPQTSCSLACRAAGLCCAISGSAGPTLRWWKRRRPHAIAMSESGRRPNRPPATLTSCGGRKMPTLPRVGDSRLRRRSWTPSRSEWRARERRYTPAWRRTGRTPAGGANSASGQGRRWRAMLTPPPSLGRSLPPTPRAYATPGTPSMRTSAPRSWPAWTSWRRGRPSTSGSQGRWRGLRTLRSCWATRLSLALALQGRVPTTWARRTTEGTWTATACPASLPPMARSPRPPTGNLHPP